MMSTPPTAASFDTTTRRSVALSAALVGITTGCLAYGASLLFGLTPLLYLPVEARWVAAWAKPEGAIAMGFYGLVLNGLAGLLLGYAVARLPPVARLLVRPSSVRALQGVALAVAASLVVFIAVHELSHWSGR